MDDMVKKPRTMPEAFRAPHQFGDYWGLHTFDTRSQIVMTSWSKVGTPYSDIEIEHMIASVKLAKQKACEDADRHVAILTAMLKGEN